MFVKFKKHWVRMMTLKQQKISQSDPVLIRQFLKNFSLIQSCSGQNCLQSRSSLIRAYQRCVWTGFWIFWIRTQAASNRIRSEVFFAVAWYGLDLYFVFTEKNVAGSLLDLYFPRLKQESDCLVLVGTGSGWLQNSKNRIGSGLKKSESEHL